MSNKIEDYLIFATAIAAIFTLLAVGGFCIYVMISGSC